MSTREVWDILQDDHDRQRRLLALIVACHRRREAGDLVARLRGELAADASIKERYLYEALASEIGEMSMAERGISRCRKVRSALAALDAPRLSELGWRGLVFELHEVVLRQMKEEEAVVFPLARRVLRAKQVAELTAALHSKPALPNGTAP